ncbi:sensor histidine kinase [Pelomonas cellulosilytica]|uniref:histidine kinase n=1 Tax=Pelomonas cellulosilytica TaxID=2906762 RepID=A0ABS8Y052_9BURK|nr:sensor histidine kinase [Pelomonas sp. P8]MCE4558214.1 sensor histidine kinase [Pelomonas sp. P8]
MPATPTLRRRMAHLLAWPLLTVLVLSAVYDYVQALQRAQDDQDRALARVAIALASRLDVDADDGQADDFGLHLTRTVAALQRAEPLDRLAFFVRRVGGQVLGGDPGLARWVQASPQDRAVFADASFDGQPWRVTSYAHESSLGQLQILVAETTHRRERQSRRLMLDTLVPNVLLVLLALGGVLAGVRLAMRPLDVVSRRIAARAADDLGPVPLAGLPGELAPFAGTINQLLDRVREAAAHQQAFLSNAAHQLRTPLAGIQTQLELAERDAPPALRERLAQVRLALQRLARSTHQMLALARSGPQAVQQEALEPVDLAALLEGAANDWLDAALASGVELHFDATPVQVRGSPWLLREALANLIHNALQHAPPGSAVQVSCGPERAGAQLAVQDQGPGIPADERERVLERFYQRPGRQGGSGLGLSIVHEVARRHGARLVLADTTAGPGLRVSLHFPSQA